MHGAVRHGSVGNGVGSHNSDRCERLGKVLPGWDGFVMVLSRDNCFGEAYQYTVTHCKGSASDCTSTRSPGKAQNNKLTAQTVMKCGGLVRCWLVVSRHGSVKYRQRALRVVMFRQGCVWHSHGTA